MQQVFCLLEMYYIEIKCKINVSRKTFIFLIPFNPYVSLFFWGTYYIISQYQFIHIYWYIALDIIDDHEVNSQFITCKGKVSSGLIFRRQRH